MTIRSRLFQLLITAITIVLATAATASAATIQIAMPFDGFASVDLLGPDGKLARRVLEGERLEKGRHTITIPGEPLPPGDYTWSGLAHRGLGASLRGWADCGGNLPWETKGGMGGWGGSGGVPRAVAADENHVYLGWDHAREGAAILALDNDDDVLWRLPSERSCLALGAEAGIVFALTAANGESAEIVRLNAKDGTPARWDNRETNRLPITSLWPVDAETKFREADTLAVANGRLYLSFTEPGFVAVLDSESGAYVTTLTGPEPGAMALSTTPMLDPADLSQTIIADFGIVSIASRAVSYFVMPHDPPWIAANTTRWLPEGERLTALAMRGDTMQSGDVQLYLGLDAPTLQVHARPATDPRDTTYSAGRPGGRPGRGPWIPDTLARIRAMAFDSRDRLWIAEDGRRPPRFSVWSTDGQTGRLLKQSFGPAAPGALGGAVFPLDPDIMIGSNCEWRIDPASGHAECLGVIPGPAIIEAQFSVAENNRVYLSALHEDGSASVFERRGVGDFWLRSRVTIDEGVASFWAETSTDGTIQSGETVETKGRPGDTLGLAPGLGLRFGSQLFEAGDWTASGAPIYEALDAEWISDEPGNPESRLCGLLEFPKPLGHVRVIAESSGQWRFLSEAGLLIGTLFESDPEKVRFPEKAVPGADMSHANSGASASAIGGSVTRTSDGRVYAQAGRVAFWNLEITGLETAEALSGGTLSIPEVRSQ